MKKGNKSVTKAASKNNKIERRGRRKLPSRDLKRNVTIRLKNATREMLEDDFNGKLQRAIDFLCARHEGDRQSKKYMERVKEFLRYTQNNYIPEISIAHAIAISCAPFIIN